MLKNDFWNPHPFSFKYQHSWRLHAWLILQHKLLGSYSLWFSAHFVVFCWSEQIDPVLFHYIFPTWTGWFHITFIPFVNAFLFSGKFISRPWEWCLYWLHTRSLSTIFLLRSVRKQKDSSCSLAWIISIIPCIFQHFSSNDIVNFLLIDIFASGRVHISIFSCLKLVMGPEAIVEGEVVLFFILLSILI